jgi:hypothetical protein
VLGQIECLGLRQASLLVGHECLLLNKPSEMLGTIVADWTQHLDEQVRGDAVIL